MVVIQNQLNTRSKQGSWPIMAEIELSVPNRHCLDRYMPDKVTLAEESTAWATARDSSGAIVDWRFTTGDARIKLKRLTYPLILDRLLVSQTLKVASVQD